MCLIWRERRKENWSDLGVFYPGPLKKISPNREKMGEKRWDYHFGKIWPHVLAFFFWLVSVFFIFFPPPPPPPSSISSPVQPHTAFVSFILDKIVPWATISLLPSFYLYICYGCFFHPFIFSHLFWFFVLFFLNKVSSIYNFFLI